MFIFDDRVKLWVSLFLFKKINKNKKYIAYLIKNVTVNKILFSIIIISVAGGEAVIGLSIIVGYYRLRGNISLTAENK